jgi:hypothetical protein
VFKRGDKVICSCFPEPKTFWIASGVAGCGWMVSRYSDLTGTQTWFPDCYLALIDPEPEPAPKFNRGDKVIWSRDGREVTLWIDERHGEADNPMWNASYSPDLLGEFDYVAESELALADPKPDPEPQAPETADSVNSPAHYTSHPSGVECIAITEHMGFCLGNAVKYLWRADQKGSLIEDLKKARWYIDREISRREQEERSR